MDWKLELVTVPVSDVDRAKDFYVDKAGFNADHDHAVSEGLRSSYLLANDRSLRASLRNGTSSV